MTVQNTDQSEGETYLGVAKSAFSIQFVTWVIAFTVGFIVAVMALESLGAGTTVTFLAGIVFGEISDKVVDYFTDWYIAEKTASEVSA